MIEFALITGDNLLNSGGSMQKKVLDFLIQSNYKSKTRREIRIHILYAIITLNQIFSLQLMEIEENLSI